MNLNSDFLNLFPAYQKRIEDKMIAIGQLMADPAITFEQLQTSHNELLFELETIFQAINGSDEHLKKIIRSQYPQVVQDPLHLAKKLHLEENLPKNIARINIEIEKKEEEIKKLEEALHNKLSGGEIPPDPPSFLKKTGHIITMVLLTTGELGVNLAALMRTNMTLLEGGGGALAMAIALGGSAEVGGWFLLQNKKRGVSILAIITAIILLAFLFFLRATNEALWFFSLLNVAIFMTALVFSLVYNNRYTEIQQQCLELQKQLDKTKKALDKLYDKKEQRQKQLTIGPAINPYNFPFQKKPAQIVIPDCFKENARQHATHQKEITYRSFEYIRIRIQQIKQS